MSFAGTEFWIALLEIIGVNIVLSGDNAVVIALAARSLPRAEQKRAIAWGSGAAVIMRIALTIVALELLRLPYLKLVGAALLLWIAVQLLIPEDDAEGHGKANAGFMAAIRTILIADLAMSLDNVIAVAAAAKGNVTLLVLGLAISIPLVVFASRLLLTLMERWPVIITLGAGLLGWVAGEMVVTDHAIASWIEAHAAWLHYVAPAAGIAVAVLVGKWLALRAERAQAERRAPPAVVPAHPAGRLQRVLLAVDGSEHAAHAARFLLDLYRNLREGAGFEVHVVNVQRPLSGDVAAFVPAENIDAYHQERSEQALAPVRTQLGTGGITPREHRIVGEPGTAIARLSQSEDCDLIVMGTRGLGMSGGALLGSVAQATTAHATVPVLLVK